MKITLITAFPELLTDYLAASVLGRGVSTGKLDVEILNLRDYAEGAYRQIDDFSFGGGGMVLMAEPLQRALQAASSEEKPYVVYPSPQGVQVHQELVEEIAQQKHIAIVCGHYEGVDERFVSQNVDLEVSLGDFVLTGGELPALALVDALARLVPGVVGKCAAVEEDSFYAGMLDNAHYTRPSEWRGEKVPSVLTGGHSGQILAHRRREAAERTIRRRPDLLTRAGIAGYITRGVYIVWEKQTPSQEQLLGVERSASAFGVKKIILVSSDAPLSEWLREKNQKLSERGEIPMLKVCSTLQRAVAWVEEREKISAFKIRISEQSHSGSVHWIPLKRRILEKNLPPLFIFGGKDPSGSDPVMSPIRSEGGVVHLPIQSALGVVLDRFFGWR